MGYVTMILLMLQKSGEKNHLGCNVGKGLVNPPPSTIEGKGINIFNWLWRDSLCAIVSLLLNVLGTMFWILYWQMYCWLAGLAACCFCFLFPFPFSFHLISSHFIPYLFSLLLLLLLLLLANAKNQWASSTFWWFRRVVNKVPLPNCMKTIKFSYVFMQISSKKSMNIIKPLVIQEGSK